MSLGRTRRNQHGGQPCGKRFWVFWNLNRMETIRKYQALFGDTASKLQPGRCAVAPRRVA